MGKVCLAAVLAALALPATALADLSANPAKVRLGPHTDSVTVVVTNKGPEPIRLYAVSACEELLSTESGDSCWSGARSWGGFRSLDPCWSDLGTPGVSCEITLVINREHKPGTRGYLVIWQFLDAQRFALIVPVHAVGR